MAFGDAFVPNFNEMKNYRCDFVETIYDQSGSVVATNNLHRTFNLDDANKKIYLQKERIFNVPYYDVDKIEFKTQYMTDDYIMLTDVVINRQTNEYISNSKMTYDNPAFGVKKSKAVGSCRFLN